MPFLGKGWLVAVVLLFVGAVIWVACEAPAGNPTVPPGIASDSVGADIRGDTQADKEAAIHAELSRLRARLEAKGVPEDRIAAGLIRAEQAMRAPISASEAAHSANPQEAPVFLGDWKAALSANFQQAAERAKQSGVSEADVEEGWNRIQEAAEQAGLR